MSPVCVQRIKNTGFSCYNVTPLQESLCSTLFAAVYKRPSEVGLGTFSFALGFWTFCLAFGFLPLSIGKKFLLWVFWCGKLLEGKRIIEGENC
jgi:fatty acid desaturase